MIQLVLKKIADYKLKKNKYFFNPKCTCIQVMLLYKVTVQ